jgi:SulP family sulfate permease
VLRSYKPEWIAGDLRGGLTACVVMIPSVIAYANLANLPAEQGLYAALVGMLGYALFASSRQVIAGPDDAITLLMAAAVGPLAGGDPARVAALSAATALLGGVTMLLAAALRVGMVADFLSKPVLIGYMTGAAAILVSTQLGRFLGLRLEHQGFFAILVELAGRIHETHPPTLLLGLGFLILLAVANRWFPQVPGALLVVVVALTLAAFVDLEGRGLAVVGHVPARLPGPRLPEVSLDDLRMLFPGALGVALLTFPDSILLARGFAVKNRYALRPTQELVALAVSNLAAGSFQGFSVGASQSRTSVNDEAGGRTQVSSLIAAASLAIFLLFLTPVLRPLPIVALSAILIFSGVKLIDVSAYAMLRRISRPGFLIAALVTAGVLVSGVVSGILIGVTLSLVLVLGRLARPTDAVLKEIPGTRQFHDMGDTGEVETVPGLIAYRFYAPLFFANADHFIERARSLIDASPTPVRWFLLDAQAIVDVDVTGADALGRLIEELDARGIALKIARANRPLRETLARIGLRGQLGAAVLFPSVHEAIAAFEEMSRRD